MPDDKPRDVREDIREEFRPLVESGQAEEGLVDRLAAQLEAMSDGDVQAIRQALGLLAADKRSLAVALAYMKPALGLIRDTGLLATLLA